MSCHAFKITDGIIWFCTPPMMGFYTIEERSATRQQLIAGGLTPRPKGKS